MNIWRNESMIEFKYRHVHISCFLSIYTYLVPISVVHTISSYAPVINPSVFSKVPAETEWYPATVGSENWHIGIPIKPYRDYSKPWHYRIPITSTKKWNPGNSAGAPLWDGYISDLPTQRLESWPPNWLGDDEKATNFWITWLRDHTHPKTPLKLKHFSAAS